MKKPISIINQDVLKKLLLLSKQMTDGIDQYENLGIKIHLIEEVKELKRIEKIKFLMNIKI